MLEYWMGNNESALNATEFEIQEVIEDPGSASLFAGYPPWLLYFAACCCALFMLVGIPGNLITVAALFRTKKLRNATAVFIMNLSTSDLFFCCFNLPLATSTFWNSAWTHGPLLCRLFPLMRYGLVAVSLFTVLAITINRYIMISHPRLYPNGRLTAENQWNLCHRLYKRRSLLLMVLATWVGGFGALIPTWFEQWGRFGLDPLIGSCSILPDVNGRSPKQFLFILAFVAPCVAISVCYARIFIIVRKTAKKSRGPEITQKFAGLQPKLSKTTEDSAIGSMSCQVTHTTASEYGGSPLKCDHHNLMVGCARERTPSLRKTSLPTTVEQKQQQQQCEERVIPEVRVHDNHSDSNFARSLEQLPYIDVNNCGNLQATPKNGLTGSEQILDSQNLQKSGVSASRFLSPPSTYRYDEVSDDGASSRSNSPPERRRASACSRPGDITPSNSCRGIAAAAASAARRGSRLRSVRGGRAFDGGGNMSTKDRKLLKMICVIFVAFLVCYLPITITKLYGNAMDWRGLNIAGYILIYLTTCINPVIYVVMSSEYRSAYKNVLLCKSDSNAAVNKEAARRHKKRMANEKVQRDG